MDLGIAGKVALVTGGTLGIGRACSLALAREGAKVVPVSRNRANVDAVVERITAEGGQAAGVVADCLTTEGVAAAVDGAAEHFGPPDIALYIPYAKISGRYDEIDADDMAAGNNSMVMQYFNMARLILPHMREQRWGRIVTVGSMCVRKVHRQVPHFVPNTYRMAAVGLQKTLSDDMAPYGITVNGIGTGSIGTDNFYSSFKLFAEYHKTDCDQMVEELTSVIPMKRLGTPEEIAATCLFLCSTGASYITGQTLLVDGGDVQSIL